MPLIKKCLHPARFARSALSIGLISLLISSCSTPYTFTFNDNVVFSPNSRQTEILADANFEGCLNQLFISSGNNDPAQVTLLACPSAGISSIEGINALPNLEQLDLSENSVSDLRPLRRLKKLRLLSIRNNNLRNINSLISMPILRFVSLQGNDNIPCRQLDNLQDRIGNTLNRPVNCD